MSCSGQLKHKQQYIVSKTNLWSGRPKAFVPFLDGIAFPRISNMTFPRKIYKYANYAEYVPYINLYAKNDTFTKTVDMMELKYITSNHILLFGDKNISICFNSVLSVLQCCFNSRNIYIVIWCKNSSLSVQTVHH